MINALRNGAAYLPLGSRVPALKKPLHLAPPFLLDDYMPRVSTFALSYMTSHSDNHIPVHDVVFGGRCEEAVEGVRSSAELQPVSPAVWCEQI